MIDQAGIMMAQGASIACERIQGINDNMSKSHYHEYFELYYLEKGQRLHMIHDQLYRLSQGGFIIFPPYVMHHSYGEMDVPFKRLLLYFRKEEVSTQSVLKALSEGSGVYPADTKAGGEIHRLLQLLLKEQEKPEAFREIYQHTLLNLLLLTIIRQGGEVAQPQKSSRIGEVIGYIHNNYQEDMNLEQLAQMFYISPYHLCREFKKQTNSTIVQYINVTRIMHAQRKFMETDKNITEISKDTGFSNLTHFNRVFKAVTGMTPSQYRRQYRDRG